MRISALSAIAGALAVFAADATAQIQCTTGTSFDMPAFNRTFTSSLTRGYYFQAPAAFTIDAYSVYDETAAGEQSVEIYLDSAAPPPFSQTSNPPLAFSEYQVPTGTRPCGLNVAAGQWVIIVGGTTAPGTNTPINNSYSNTSAGGFQISLGGVPVTVNRCGTQVSIAANPGPNAIFSSDGFELGRIDLCVTVTGNVPPALEGVVEPTPFANTKSADDQNFFDGDFIRWGYNDIAGTNAGQFGATVLNVGLGGPPAIGVTAEIPGFNQLWAGSTPSGIETVYGPFVVGAADQIVFVPPGLFGNGDVVRIQALILDPNAAGTFPVTPMFNTISYTYTPPPPVCTIQEDFDTTATGVGSYPTGWSDGGGGAQWSCDDNGTPSTATGPTAAFNGANYMYTETSQGTAGLTYIMNTDTYTDQTVSQMSFYLSRIGATMGTLEVFYNDGVNPPASLGTWTGPNASQSQGGDEWELITLPFTPSASYSFQFVYTRGASFTGDCAVDRFCLGN